MEGLLGPFVIRHYLLGFDLPGRIPKFEFSARPASSFLFDHDSRLPQSLFGNNIKDLGRFRLSVPWMIVGWNRRPISGRWDDGAAFIDRRLEN
jgi:hypothetical protein